MNEKSRTSDAESQEIRKVRRCSTIDCGREATKNIVVFSTSNGGKIKWLITQTVCDECLKIMQELYPIEIIRNM